MEVDESRQATDATVTTQALSEGMRAVARAQHRLSVDMARRLNLAASDVWALEHLFADGSLGPVALGQRLGMTSASVTALIDRLEQAGHVARRPHPSDRRRLVITATPRAEEAAYDALAPFFTELEAAGKSLSPEERIVVKRYLDRVLAAMRSFEATTVSRDDTATP